MSIPTSTLMFRTLAGAALAAGVLFAGVAEAKTRMMHVQLLKSQQATFENGSKATVYVVKMNGHTMVAIPAENIPDALHQQLFTVKH
ncbi:hypothetical protein [Methylocella silvestris]|uniref:Uncharacterized protein n=1 Tax=Methylocella silvestris TaxID=199596 RepID=A0A2J7TES5_METSI|nr:hypothetical protein [Methylocella silvestris]PNG25272.1 hypothetical protein CR492_14055 [Methylocella silvestris]